jgi:ATP-dependent RNA helicase DeaD
MNDMNGSIFSEVPAGLGPVLEQRGFSTLTDVQQSVLDCGLSGVDLQISSQTGSGKTVALGLVVADIVEAAVANKRATTGPARPAVLLVAPTRELAVQLAEELTWLFRPLRAQVGSLTGGTSLGGDIRMLRRNPPVLVGTPGRLIDHLNRGTLALDEVAVIALDEADEMLSMGFYEEISTILDETPETRRTHLVSATFPSTVRSMAARYQRDAVMISGSAPGEANADICYRTMVVPMGDRLSALINILLMDPDGKTLVFVRTRNDATDLSMALSDLGFAAQALSGELSQRERTATLTSFREGGISILVATDVAARGLDVHDIAQVVHVDLPDNAELLTHRSGRTGRAGRKGTSTILVTPYARGRVNGMLRRAGIQAIHTEVPSPSEVNQAADERLLESFTLAADHSSDLADRRYTRLAEQLLVERDPVNVVTTLLEQSSYAGPCEPREVRRVSAEHRQHQGSQGRRSRAQRSGDWVRFQVSWGSHHGADPRRLLAMVCRRGGITSGDVGSIKISDRSSMIEVTGQVAREFARSASRPDSRDPRIKFREWRDKGSNPKKRR